jgi:hypothetical protein
MQLDHVPGLLRALSARAPADGCAVVRAPAAG